MRARARGVSPANELSLEIAWRLGNMLKSFLAQRSPMAPNTPLRAQMFVDLHGILRRGVVVLHECPR